VLVAGAQLFRWVTWFLAVAMAIGALPNLASRSRWENFIFGLLRSFWRSSASPSPVVLPVRRALLYAANAGKSHLASSAAMAKAGFMHVVVLFESLFGNAREVAEPAEEKKDEAEQHEIEPGAEGPGVRDWFADLPKAAKGNKAAAFDTRGDARMAG
jgi:hypothetical protein